MNRSIKLYQMRFTTILIALALIAGCEAEKKQLIYADTNEEQNSELTNERQEEYSDPDVKCVLMIKLGRTKYPADKFEFNRLSDIDTSYREKLSVVSSGYYPAVSKSFSKDYSKTALMYNVVPSYSSCENTKKILGKIHSNTYGVKPEFKKATLNDYVHLVRGG